MKKDGAMCSGARGLGPKKGSGCSVRENGSQQVFLTPSGSCSSPIVGIRGNPKLISQSFQRLVSGRWLLLPGKSAPDTEQGFPLVEAGSQDTICQPRGGVRSMRCEGSRVSVPSVLKCSGPELRRRMLSRSHPYSIQPPPVTASWGRPFLQRAGALSPSREFCAQVVGDMEVILDSGSDQ